jgi:signal transduction histidine kinase
VIFVAVDNILIMCFCLGLDLSETRLIDAYTKEKRLVNFMSEKSKQVVFARYD